MNTGAPIVAEKVLAELQTDLENVDLWESASRSTGSLGIKLLLYEHKHVKIRMRREQNHSHPHFHLEYKKELSASYSIDPFGLLAGNFPEKYEERVKGWIIKHQADLLATWQALQTSDIRELVQERANGR